MQEDYNKTLNLPKTDFSMRAGLPQKEPQMLADWLANDLYEKWFGQHSKLKLPARSFKWDSDKISE